MAALLNLYDTSTLHLLISQAGPPFASEAARFKGACLLQVLSFLSDDCIVVFHASIQFGRAVIYEWNHCVVFTAKTSVIKVWKTTFIRVFGESNHLKF